MDADLLISSLLSEAVFQYFETLNESRNILAHRLGSSEHLHQILSTGVMSPGTFSEYNGVCLSQHGHDWAWNGHGGTMLLFRRDRLIKNNNLFDIRYSDRNNSEDNAEIDPVKIEGPDSHRLTTNLNHTITSIDKATGQVIRTRTIEGTDFRGEKETRSVGSIVFHPKRDLAGIAYLMPDELSGSKDHPVTGVRQHFRSSNPEHMKSLEGQSAFLRDLTPHLTDASHAQRISREHGVPFLVSLQSYKGENYNPSDFDTHRLMNKFISYHVRRHLGQNTPVYASTRKTG